MSKQSETYFKNENDKTTCSGCLFIIMIIVIVVVIFSWPH